MTYKEIVSFIENKLGEIFVLELKYTEHCKERKRLLEIPDWASYEAESAICHTLSSKQSDLLKEIKEVHNIKIKEYGCTYLICPSHHNHVLEETNANN